MKASIQELLAHLPGAATPKWPDGVFDVNAMAHGTMSLEVFAPRGIDRQTPHDQDELYIVVSGRSEFVTDAGTTSVGAGDALFVEAGDEHRFVGMSDDFVTWVIFWGPSGGEAPAPEPSSFASVDA